MAKTVLAELVTKMTVESTQFKKELEKTTAKTVAFSKSQKQAANDADGASKKISNAFRRAANASSTLQGPMGGVSSRLSTLATGFSAVGVAATAAGVVIGGLTIIAGASVKAFSRFEQGVLRTEALVKSTGGAAGKTAEDLEKLTRSVALSTLASVDGVRSAVNVLQTFKTVQGTTFDRTIALSQDLAAVMGSDIKSAALQLGKALEDPITGLSALRRSGVSFTDSQKEMIRTMVDTGKTAEAQKLILDTLQGQIGGAGAAEAGGLAGAVDTLGQRWQELLEGFAETSTVGTSATSALNAIAAGLGNITNKFFSQEDKAAKLNRLFEEYGAIQEKLNNPRQRGKTVLQARLNAIKEEIDAINKETLKQSEVFRQGALSRRQQEEEETASKIAESDKRNLIALNAIESGFDSQIDAISRRMEERNNKIAELNLSQEEVERQGFENIQQLRDYYLTLSADKAENEYQQLLLRNEKQVEAEQEKQRRILELEQQAADRRLALESQISQQLTQMKIDVANQAAGALAAAAEEGSKAQEIAFYFQKALAIATTIMNTEMAAIAALAPPPIGLGPVDGAPYAAGIRTMGYISAGIIGATAIAGAREMGGPVSGGKTYLVGERGPELFTPGATGQITSNANLQKAMDGGAAPTIQIIQQSTVYGSEDELVFRALSRSPKKTARLLQSYLKYKT